MAIARIPRNIHYKYKKKLKNGKKSAGNSVPHQSFFLHHVKMVLIDSSFVIKFDIFEALNVLLCETKLFIDALLREQSLLVDFPYP